ncbi:MAG: phosphatase [Oscillospiraceae bacterium]
MKIIADLHCHTIASDHAYSTVNELIDQAKKIGLKAFALTDHGPAIGDAPHKWHFSNLAEIPTYMDDLLVLKGIESNIVDYDGNIDLEESLLKKLHIVIASFHNPVIEGRNKDIITKTMLNVAKNPYVDIIGHSGTPDFSFDYEYVIKELKFNNKLVEINSNTFNIRQKSIDNCISIAKICKNLGCKIVVNSDAHSIYNLGNFDNAINMLKSIDFPEELIVNSDIDLLKNHIKEKKNIVL